MSHLESELLPETADGLAALAADGLAKAARDPYAGVMIWVTPPVDPGALAVAAQGYAAVAHRANPVTRIAVVLHTRAAGGQLAVIDGHSAGWTAGFPGLTQTDDVADDMGLHAHKALASRCFPDAAIDMIAVGKGANAHALAGLIRHVVDTPGGLAVVSAPVGDGGEVEGIGVAARFAAWAESHGRCGAGPAVAAPLGEAVLSLAPDWRFTRLATQATAGRALCAIVAEVEQTAVTPPGPRARLLRLARMSLENAANYQPAVMIEAGMSLEAPALHALRACHVMIPGTGHVRRLTSVWAPARAVAVEVAHLANRVATIDPITPRPSREEAKSLAQRIIIASPPQPLAAGNEADVTAGLRPNFDGLVLARRRRSAVLLPDAWDVAAMQPERMGAGKLVAVAKQRIGLRSGDWADDVQAYRFTAEMF